MTAIRGQRKVRDQIHFRPPVFFEAVTITYDSNNRVLSITKGSKTWTMTRDIDDCIISITDGTVTRTITNLDGFITGVA